MSEPACGFRIDLATTCATPAVWVIESPPGPNTQLQKVTACHDHVAPTLQATWLERRVPLTIRPTKTIAAKFIPAGAQPQEAQPR